MDCMKKSVPFQEISLLERDQCVVEESMAKPDRKKWSKEGITIKEQNCFLESRSNRIHAFWAVVAILGLIIVISAITPILKNGNERNVISVPSSQLDINRRQGKPFLAIPSKQNIPEKHHGGMSHDVAFNSGDARRIFKRSPTDALASSCNCSYDSPLALTDQTSGYTYTVYQQKSTNWTCALVCCEESPIGRASLANPSDTYPSFLHQFPYVYLGMPVSYWTATFCNYSSEIQGHITVTRTAQGIGFPCTPDRLTMLPFCQIKLSKGSTATMSNSGFATSDRIRVTTHQQIPSSATEIQTSYSVRNSKITGIPPPSSPPLQPPSSTDSLHIFSTWHEAENDHPGQITKTSGLEVTKHTRYSYMPESTAATIHTHFSPTLMVNTQLMECSNAVCLSETTTGCSLDGHKCVCMAGYQGIACQRPIDHCSDHQCRFGQCINHNDTYLCKCLSGYGGQKCDITVGRSTDPTQVYNAVVQGLGTIWVLISAGFSFIVLTALRDNSPIACLSRHFLVALFCEHLMVALFHNPVVLLSADQSVCHWISLVILYFRGVHMILTLFLTYHIHYIMTGVTSGHWGWNGDWRIFETLAWGSPILACLAIWAVSFQDLATGFTCMMNWETHGIRWFMIMLPLTLLSLSSLEQAHTEMHFQKNCTSSVVDSVQLRGAQVTLWGMYFLIILAPMSYMVCSYAVFTGSPYYFSFGCGCNIALGIKLLVTFVITNQYAWNLLVKWFRDIQKRVVGKIAGETEELNSMDMHTPVDRWESRYEQRMIGRVRYTWS